MKTVIARAATIAAVCAVAGGLAAGTANARPWEGPRCLQLHNQFVSSYEMAAAYQNEGNTKQARAWNKTGDAQYSTYIREGCN